MDANTHMATRTRSSSASGSPRGTRRAASPPPAPPSHHLTDTLGIVALGAALLVAVALGLGNTGLIGDALSRGLRLLVGVGSWSVPVGLALLGWGFLAGKSPNSARFVTIGICLALMGFTGAIARSAEGDYLAVSAVESSGGYLGGLVATATTALFGQASAIIYGVFIAVGLVCCLNVPLRSLAGKLRRPRPAVSEDEGPARPKSRAAQLEEDAEASRRRAKLVEDSTLEVEATTPRPIERMKAAITPRPPAPASPIERDVGDIIARSAEEVTNKEGYELPPLSLLREPPPRPKRSKQEMQRNIETLLSTLEQFNIEANVVEVATGPTITRYEVQLGPGVRVNRITALADNIAMNMAALALRVEAPIPGKAAIGVEIPNAVRHPVTLRELCESLEFHDHESRLLVALGRDVSGNPQYADLTRMPHLLIGGATNSGKSICLATIITSLLVRNTPKDLKMVMIDPKRVELSLFEGVPHLMCPVVKDVKEAPGVLRAVWREMDRRYDMFSNAQVRNIDGWNAKASFADKLPYIVVVIDELADLMMQAANEVEASICRLAQLARATGIHLVIATQRPSVDVITGTIKANIASRVAFSVSSQIDSRTILDQGGAERLIGKGDMLFLPIDASKPIRVQGCYVGEDEIEAVCEHWKKQEKPHYVLDPVAIAVQEREAEIREKQESDELWDDAVRFVVERQQASTSMLQRRFSIGFQRASRLLDSMEERGIVGPRDGSKPRDILVDVMQLEVILGGYDDQYLTPMPEGAFIEEDEN